MRAVSAARASPPSSPSHAPGSGLRAARHAPSRRSAAARGRRATSAEIRARGGSSLSRLRRGPGATAASRSRASTHDDAGVVVRRACRPHAPYRRQRAVPLRNSSWPTGSPAASDGEPQQQARRQPRPAGGGFGARREQGEPVARRLAGEGEQQQRLDRRRSARPAAGARLAGRLECIRFAHASPRSGSGRPRTGKPPSASPVNTTVWKLRPRSSSGVTTATPSRPTRPRGHAARGEELAHGRRCPAGRPVRRRWPGCAAGRRRRARQRRPAVEERPGTPENAAAHAPQPARDGRPLQARGKVRRSTASGCAPPPVGGADPRDARQRPRPHRRRHRPRRASSSASRLSSPLRRRRDALAPTGSSPQTTPARRASSSQERRRHRLRRASTQRRRREKSTTARRAKGSPAGGARQSARRRRSRGPGERSGRRQATGSPAVRARRPGARHRRRAARRPRSPTAKHPVVRAVDVVLVPSPDGSREHSSHRLARLGPLVRHRHDGERAVPVETRGPLPSPHRLAPHRGDPPGRPHGGNVGAPLAEPLRETRRRASPG